MAVLTDLENRIVGDGTDLPDEQTLATLQEEQTMIDEEFGQGSNINVNTQEQEQSLAVTEERLTDVEGQRVNNELPYNIVNPSEMDNFDRYTIGEYLSPDYIDRDLVQYSQPLIEGSVFGASVRQMNSLYRLSKTAAMNMLTDNNNVDDNFNIIKEYDKYKDEFPEVRQINYLYGANNKENFLNRIFQLRQDREDLQILSQAGTLESFVKGSVAAMVDIDMFVPQMAIAKLATKSAKIARLTDKMTSVGTGITTGIAANAATGVALKYSNPNYSEADFIGDIMLGGLVGGIFGGLTTNSITREQLNQIKGIEVKDNGEIDIKNIDKHVDDFIKEYNYLNNKDHSVVEVMPFTSSDYISRAYSLDKKLLKKLSSSNISARKAKELSNTLAETLGEEFRLTKAQRNALVKESRLSRESGIDRTKMYVELQEKSQTFRDSFKNISKPMEDFLASDPDFVPTIKEVDTPEGVTVKEEVTGAEVESVRKNIERTELDENEINIINKTLRSNYRKGIKQISNYKLNPDGSTHLELVSANGKVLKLNGAEADRMKANLSSMVLSDYDAGIAKVTHDDRKIYNKKLKEILNNIPEVYTDFKKALKQQHSITLQKAVDDLLVSALGDNLIGGQSAPVIKAGVFNNLSHGYSLFDDALYQKTNSIIATSDKTIVQKGLDYGVSQNTQQNVLKEISKLQNDMFMSKDATSVALSKDIDGLVYKYYDKGGSLVSSKELLDDATAVGTKFKLDPQTVRALIGLNIMGRQSLDHMQDVPKNALRAKAVEGVEELEHDFYQPQAVSKENLEILREQGFTEESIVRAMAIGYTKGMEARGSKMSSEAIKEAANLNATAAVGRVWGGIDDKQTAIGNRTKFADEIKRFITTNQDIDPKIRGNLLDMENSLRRDALESTFLKDRVPFDRTVPVNITKADGTILNITTGDLLKTPDLDTYKTYLNRVSGEVALASKGWDRRTIIENRDLMKKEFEHDGVPEGKIQFYLNLFDSILSSIQSQPNPQATKMGNWQAVNAVKQVFNLNALGGIGFSQLAETALSIHNVGIINGLNHMGMENITSKGRNFAKGKAAFFDEILSSQKFIEDVESSAYTDLEDFGKATISQKGQRLLSVSENVHRKITLLEPIRSWQRKLGWHVSMDFIIQQLEKSNWKINDRLRNAQVDQEFVNILKREIDNGRMWIDNGTLRYNYADIDVNMVFSRNDKLKLSGVIRSIENNEKLLRPQPGSSDFRLANPMIGLITHLKTYPLFSINNVFLKNLKYADRNTATLLLTTGMVSMMATYLKAYAYGLDTENITDMDAFFRYNSLLGGVGMGVDGMASLLGLPEYRISADYGKNNSFQIPIYEQINSILGLGALPVDFLSDGQISSEGLTDIKKSIPLLYNMWFAKGINSYINAVRENEKVIRKQEQQLERQQNQSNSLQLGQSPEVEQEQPKEVTNSTTEAIDTLKAFQLGE